MDIEDDPLAWILDPQTPERFISECLGVKPILCENGRRDRFRRLLSLEQLDTVLGTFGLRLPDIRLVRSDKDVPAAEYVWRDNLIDPMRVARLFAEGATVIFGALHDRHEEVRRLCTNLAIQASARTQANIYLTPPNAQGFKPHWDTHDVFVLQIDGAKRWRIYDQGMERPLAAQKFDPKTDDPGEVVSEFVLEAGNVLYIPRGVMHAAVAMDKISLHITIGLMAYTWSEFLADCLSELAEREPGWRRNLPFGFGREPGGGSASLKQELQARLGELSGAIDVERVLSARLQQNEATYRPRVTDHLQQAIAASSLSMGDVVHKRSCLPSRLETRGDRVILISGERELDFPSTALRTLETVLTERAIQLSDIDDDLDWSGRKTVISTLIREGIVTSRGANASERRGVT